MNPHIKPQEHEKRSEPKCSVCGKSVSQCTCKCEDCGRPLSKCSCDTCLDCGKEIFKCTCGVK